MSTLSSLIPISFAFLPFQSGNPSATYECLVKRELAQNLLELQAAKNNDNDAEQESWAGLALSFFRVALSLLKCAKLFSGDRQPPRDSMADLCLTCAQRILQRQLEELNSSTSAAASQASTERSPAKLSKEGGQKSSKQYAEHACTLLCSAMIMQTEAYLKRCQFKLAEKSINEAIAVIESVFGTFSSSEQQQSGIQQESTQSSVSQQPASTAAAQPSPAPTPRQNSHLSLLSALTQTGPQLSQSQASHIMSTRTGNSGATPSSTSTSGSNNKELWKEK